MNITVPFSNLNFSNLQCGDIVEDSDGEQYHIVDFIDEDVEMQKLNPDERCKQEFLAGRVNV